MRPYFLNRRLSSSSRLVGVTRPNCSTKHMIYLYVNRGKSLHAISRECGLQRKTIARRLRKHGVRIRTYEESIALLGRVSRANIEKIRELYWTNRLSSEKIGQTLGISGSWVRTVMTRSGIPRRSLSQAGMRFPKTSFTGDELEKAYLMGLRAGDLNAATYGNQVRVATSTTHPAMWRLLLSSFGKNGRVNKTPARGKHGFGWMVYAYLDRSFRFLLPKTIVVPKSYLEREDLFLSFFAGYVDAEGSFRVYLNSTHKAMSFRINSEDKLLLKDICRGLQEMGYHVSWTLAAKRGVTRGKRYRHSLWTLGMFRESEILDLVGKLHVRHNEKKRQVQLLLWSAGKKWDLIGPRAAALRSSIKFEVSRFVEEAREAYLSKHSSTR